MINLEQRDISFIFIDSSNTYLNEEVKYTSIINYLYSKGFDIYYSDKYNEGVYSSKSYLCTDKSLNNNDLRKTSLDIIKEFGFDSVYVKYLNEENITIINYKGEEYPAKITYYPGENSNIYVLNDFTLSFCFERNDRYFNITDKSQIKKGMILEYKNNNTWVKRTVQDVDKEYDKLYKLLIKYDKLRTTY